MDEPKDHAEQYGVEVDDDNNRSGQIEKLTPQLMLVSPPEIYNCGNRWRKTKRCFDALVKSLHLLLIAKIKKIPEKGETKPATVRQRARLEIGILKSN